MIDIHFSMLMFSADFPFLLLSCSYSLFSCIEIFWFNYLFLYICVCFCDCGVGLSSSAMNTNIYKKKGFGHSKDEKVQSKMMFFLLVCISQICSIFFSYQLHLLIGLRTWIPHEYLLTVAFFSIVTLPPQSNFFEFVCSWKYFGLQTAYKREWRSYCDAITFTTVFLSLSAQHIKQSFC